MHAALSDSQRERLVADVVDWYAHHARDLPWRAPGVTPWGVLVSEVMLQQTPVTRVLPAWQAWLARWPEPADLAATPAGEAVRQWGRLGYPRRALRLHAAAQVCIERHAGAVPSDLAALRALPGVGDYTAAAVATWAFEQAHPVLDTNVRRVLARVLDGRADAGPSVTRAERETARALLPASGAPRWSVAVMELGALLCTARSPRCGGCPLAERCAWRAAGRPEGEPRRRAQAWTGTDRQCRGTVMALARSRSVVSTTDLAACWPDDVQRERAVAGLVADGLLVCSDAGWALPG